MERERVRERERERERECVRGGEWGGEGAVKMIAPSTARLSAITVTSYRGEIWLLYLLLVFWHRKINNCSS